MIKRQEEIYNWLRVGIQQPSDRIQELFYFDKKNKEFFSILITDYFLFDNNFNIASETTSSYSVHTLQKLGEKMLKIENQSPEIIAVPRLGHSKSVLEIGSILSKIDRFLDLNVIDIENAMIWIPAESGTIILDLTDKKSHTKKRTWWKFWKS